MQHKHYLHLKFGWIQIQHLYILVPTLAAYDKTNMHEINNK